MAIQLEFLNLIVPIQVIDRHYSGGFKALIAQHLSMFGVKLWHDEHLFRDGAMNPKDIEDLVEFWKEKGLKPFEERSGKKWWKDMCVVDFFGGSTLPCDWLEHDPTDHSVYLKLVLVKRKARVGRNPATGESINIPAKTVVKMRVAKACKEAIVPPKK
jgi:hypothetical protein